MRAARASWLWLALVAAGCASAGGGPEAAAPTQEEEQAAWMKSGMPGEPHRRFAEHAGNWDVWGMMWMAPGAPPMETAGKSRLWTVMDGRYMMQEFTGTFMGMPFQGMGVSGFNNITGRYETSWWDSMGTMIMHLEGSADEHGTVTETGQFTDPFGRTKYMKEVTTPDGKDHIVFEMYDAAAPGSGGEDRKVMELHYHRTK